MGFFGGGGGAASNMVGATSSVAGTAGLAPAPAAGDHKLTLRGDATFYPSQPVIYAPQSSFTHNVGAVNGSSVAFWTYPWFNGGSAGAIGTLICFFCPILIPKQDTYTRIGVTVNTGAAGSTIGLALYDNDESNNLPKNLLASSLSGISTAAAGTYEETISVTLSAGWYHGAILASTSTTLAFRAENNLWFPFYGSSEPWGGGGRGTALQARLTNARSSVTDFPSLISSSDITIRRSGETVGGAGSSIPNIGIRKV
jgi:hypothetical protein